MAATTCHLPIRSPDKPPRPHCWAPLSLRVFFVILLVLAGCSALLIAVPAYRQKLVTREVERLGGRIEAEPLPPPGLHGIAHYVHWFDRIRTVVLMECSVSESILSQLVVEKNVEGLNLLGSQCGHSGYARIGEMSDLTWLILQATDLVDVDVHSLSRLAKLKYLDLSGTNISDAALADLNSLNVAELSLDQTNITDSGLDFLSRMRSLRVLTVRGTHVTQGGVERLNRHVPDVVIHWWQ